MRRAIPILLALVSASAAAQGSTLPGGHPTSIETQRAEYASAMRAQVDTLLHDWGEDLERRNPGWAASTYADGAVITLADGMTIARRDQIKVYYARIFKRARAAKLTVQDVTEIRGGFRVEAQLVLQLSVTDHDPYGFAMPVTLEMHPGAENRLRIDTQAGGDLPFVVALGGDKERAIPLGKGDSLRAKVTDAAGIAMPNVKVTFVVTSGMGSVSPDTAMTNGEGIATTYFSEGTVVKPSRVEAVAAVLPNEPVPFRIRATAVAP